MKFNKIVPYKIKKLIPMAMIAGATVASPSCVKNEQELHDVEIQFTRATFMKDLNQEILQRHANDEMVRTIYLVPVAEWGTTESHNIEAICKYGLEPSLEISPKIRGRGNFAFKPGEASKVPNDSLWIVQHGWTINQGKSR